ncbi:YdbH domain-containing protein [Brevundimonas sp. PAMC22021]|nr:YdbH domain-containing protein [Brevundimonas sp. PAMC22021]
MTAVLLVLLALAYLNRRIAAREVLVGWLERQGVPADVEVERIELDGFVGRIRIGDPRDPDVVVERVEVDYAVGAPWSQAGLGVTPSRIRLLRPVVRASWRQGKLSLGSLDPLVQRFTGRPPRPDARAPLVIIEQGRLRLDSEYGPVEALGDARLEDGKLMRLTARVPEAALKSGSIAARGLSGDVGLLTRGDRIALKLNASVTGFTTEGGEAEGARLNLSGELPYPDLNSRKGDGRAVVEAALAADALSGGGTRMTDAVVRTHFDGATSGWIEAFRLAGRTATTMTAARIDGPALQGRGLDVRVEGAAELRRPSDGALRWSVRGPMRLRSARLSTSGVVMDGLDARSGALAIGGRGAAVEATGRVDAATDRFVFGDLRLSRARSGFDLDLVQDGGLRLAIDGGLSAGDGAWPLFGPSGPRDGADLIEMKRALGRFTLSAPQVSVRTDRGGTRVRLQQPATVRPANGGVLTVQPARTPAYEARPGRLGGGALTLTATRGRGLPQMQAAVPSWRLTPTGFEAQVDARAGLDFDIAQGLVVQTRGRLANAGGRLTYAPQACSPFTVERLELGENDVAAVAGDLCPTTQPLLVSQNGRWRMAGAFRQVRGEAPFLGMRFDEAAGGVTVNGAAAGLSVDADVASVQVADTMTPRRFNPLSASGEARLRSERWTGGFDLASGPHAIGHLTFQHDGTTRTGGLEISAPELTFAENGLQPQTLTPLLDAFVQSPVTGSVRFDGRFGWTDTPEEGTSSGRLVIPNLDFTSPAGSVKGLQGEIDFASLAPLVTAPDQRLRVASLDAGTDITDLDLTFGLDETAITVAGARVAAGGGVISVEPLSIPLDPTQPFNGVIVLERVQLGDVVSDAGLDDKVRLDAVVSGRLPFVSDPKAGVRITGGTLQAVQPGRLSIQREVLSDVSAGGAGDAAPPGTVEDLAYQAMENLAFDMLTAEVNSLDGGRASVLFHIKGRHDPPKRQELRLTLRDLITRDFLKRQLPLPSDTGIDLTLDTTLNMNQLVSDILALNRARAGQASSEPAP